MYASRSGGTWTVQIADSTERSGFEANLHVTDTGIQQVTVASLSTGDSSAAYARAPSSLVVNANEYAGPSEPPEQLRPTAGPTTQDHTRPGPRTA